MVLLETRKKFSQAYETSVSKKRLHTKWTTLQFVVGNEQRLIRLLGTNNALRIFMVLSEKKERFSDKKFLNAIAYLQSEILIFLVFVSSGNLTFFRATLLTFRATWLRFRATWLRARWLSGDLTGYPRQECRNVGSMNCNFSVTFIKSFNQRSIKPCLWEIFICSGIQNLKTFACLALSFSTYRFVYISIERGKNSLTESQSSFAATIKRSERQR